MAVFAGDKCQQQPLKTVDKKVFASLSIVNDTFISTNAVRRALFLAQWVSDYEMVDCTFYSLMVSKPGLAGLVSSTINFHSSGYACNDSAGGQVILLIYFFAIIQHIDYAIWTGDIPAHNIWNQSRSNQVQFKACYTILVNSQLRLLHF